MLWGHDILRGIFQSALNAVDAYSRFYVPRAIDFNRHGDAIVSPAIYNACIDPIHQIAQEILSGSIPVKSKTVNQLAQSLVDGQGQFSQPVKSIFHHIPKANLDDMRRFTNELICSSVFNERTQVALGNFQYHFGLQDKSGSAPSLNKS